MTAGRPFRLPRLAAPVALVLACLGAGCSGQSPFEAAADTTVAASAATTPGTAVVANDFIPQDQNVTDCVSLVERPNCGSKSKGGWRMYLVFLVLAGGLTIIGWRVVRGVRARDAVLNAPATTPPRQGG